MTASGPRHETKSRGQGARPIEHLGAANSQPDRHAGHRDQESGGGQVAGSDLAPLDRIAAEIERVVKSVPGVSSALAERLAGGRYVDVRIDRDAAARCGLNVADVQSVVASAVGGDNIGETIEGLQRFLINLRYPREVRDSVDELRQQPVW